jgi:uncharacterized protein (TIGR02246 family)
MRPQIQVVLAFVVLGLLGGCAPSTPSGSATAPMGADEATIRAGTETWNTAYNAGDVDRILALYADDSVVMPPNESSITGLAALREYLTKDIAASKAAGIVAKDGVSSVAISGDLAWHAGTSSVVDAAGKTVETGKYLEVWRRTNGRWLMVRDIWNDDAPPAPPPSK